MKYPVGQKLWGMQMNNKPKFTERKCNKNGHQQTTRAPPETHLPHKPNATNLANYQFNNHNNNVRRRFENDKNIVIFFFFGIDLKIQRIE